MNVATETRINRILIIDDNLSIHADIRKILGGEDEQNAELDLTKALLFGETEVSSPRTGFSIDSAYQGQEGLELVQKAAAEGNPYALAFVDVRMPPGWDGVETIGHLWKSYPELQIVICTAYSDYSWEEMIHKLGHSPNLVVLKKPFDNIEVLQLAHALTDKWHLNRKVRSQLENLDTLVHQRTAELESANAQLKREIAARIEAEKILRLSEERFSKAFSASPIPLAIQALQQQTLVDANDAFLKMLGGDRNQVIGLTTDELRMWSDVSLATNILQTLKTQGSVRNKACTVRTLSGQERQTLISVELIELVSGPHLLVILQDITDQLKMETQLLQSQKMEAVGQLAAGVAHDFNNILTAIHGHTSLLQAQFGQHPSFTGPLNVISLAAERATRLVRQLLAFSRKQVLKPQQLNIGQVASGLAEMLKRVIGEHIQLDVSAAPDLPLIEADLSMMEQVILNLSVNARDAMARGGNLSIHTEVLNLTSAELKHPGVGPGDYICLSVTDTGCGIPPELLPRIFDPFFTTKEIGKGTGLGLATVYGIVKQHSGWVDVQSTLGKGSCFRVFLPVCNKQVPPPPTNLTPAPKLEPQHGSECILVVEDEDLVRSMAVSLLKDHGYRVLEACSGKDAIEVFRSHSSEVDLLFTDVMMPGNILGDELASRLCDAKPSLAVLFTSGYTPEVARADLQEGINFLSKPFTPSQMLTLIRQSLNHSPRDNQKLQIWVGRIAPGPTRDATREISTSLPPADPIIPAGGPGTPV
jgi:two-component system cell cycle sensor histidine kinase/response regulator CckA